MTDKDFQQFVVEHLVKLSEGQEKLSKDIARLEVAHGEKLSSLFDDRSVNQDYFKTIKNTLARIENNLQTQSFMIIELKGKQEDQETELRLLRAEK